MDLLYGVTPSASFLTDPAVAGVEGGGDGSVSDTKGITNSTEWALSSCLDIKQAAFYARQTSVATAQALASLYTAASMATTTATMPRSVALLPSSGIIL